MDKMAQRRSIFNQIREKANIPGAYLEGFLKPELERVMISLKDLDDRIRAILTGQKIGDADAPDDGISAKDLLKKARSNFSRREYMTAVADLGLFHKKMSDVASDISKFVLDVNQIHHKFLFEGMPEDYQGKLQGLREHMQNLQQPKKAAITTAGLIKKAGIMDFFYRIGTKRGRSLAIWEKKYPKQTKALRDGGERLLNDAQRLLDNSISYLKQMATARATRRPDEYMDLANQMKAEFNKFDNGDKGFRAYYNNAIMPWLQIKDEIEAKEKAATEKTQQAEADKKVVEQTGEEEQAPNTVPNPPLFSTPQLPPINPPPQQLRQQSPVNVPPGMMTSEPAAPLPRYTLPDEQAPDTERSPTPQQDNLPIPLTNVKKSHQSFYRSLETLSKEDPRILAAYISKYASSIQHKDPKVALQLFSIVQKIRA